MRKMRIIWLNNSRNMIKEMAKNYPILPLSCSRILQYALLLSSHRLSIEQQQLSFGKKCGAAIINLCHWALKLSQGNPAISQSQVSSAALHVYVCVHLPSFHLSSEETTFWIIVGCSDGVSNGSRIVKRIKNNVF